MNLQTSFSLHRNVDKNKFRKIVSHYTPISWYKILEIECFQENSSVLGFECRISSKCNRAGASLLLALFTFTFSISFYDIRYWDNKKKVYIEHEND